MAPKKDKGKKDEEKVGVFNEVERTFMEQEIAECNRKIARLRTALEDYEARNEKLQNDYDKLDEDRADIIAFMKKTLNIKNEENIELKDKVKGLEEIRDIENAQFHNTVSELRRDFTVMKDQLTSENKLLAGKLNTLEEFRAIRDDLMKKFEKQEKDFEDQEMKYKRIIYDAEKKFVIGKDKLKKEMEARLLQLAQDFQDATELRVAASTHRVIRENIAICNELDVILTSQQKVSDQNELYKERIRAANIAKELAEEERDTAINKSVVQLKVIEQLTAAFDNIKKEKGLFEKKSYDLETLQAKIEKLTKENDNLALQVRILEQNLHAKLSDQNKAIVDASKTTKERDKLRKTLQEAAFAIQAALKLDQWANADPERGAMDRRLLLSHLLEIVSQFRDIEGSQSLATIASFSKIYDEGDLGFVPKPTTKKKITSSSSSIVQQIQKQQQPDSLAADSKKSDITESVSSTSVSSSIKTIPSIQVLPSIASKALTPSKASMASFATSTQSVVSQDEKSVKENTTTDLEQKLLASKLEIQKSILKDLAFSQGVSKQAMSVISTTSLSARKSSVSVTPKASMIMKKRSVTIAGFDDQETRSQKESTTDQDKTSELTTVAEKLEGDTIEREKVIEEKTEEEKDKGEDSEEKKKE